MPKLFLIYAFIVLAGLTILMDVRAIPRNELPPARPSFSVAAPQVMAVLWTGHNLIVLGEGFDAGSTVVINGVSRKTKNDPADPTSKLIAKKAAKGLVAGAPFGFTRPWLTTIVAA